MKIKVVLLAVGVISIVTGWALVIMGESRDIPVGWIIVAAAWAAVCFKLFYTLDGGGER